MSAHETREAAEEDRFAECFTCERRLWLGAESNRRHVDFQSTALPTELPSRDGADRVAPWGVHYATMSLWGKRCPCEWWIVVHVDQTAHSAVSTAAGNIPAVSAIHCASRISSYNRPHEEDHFLERGAGGDRPLLASGAQRTLPFLQRPNSARSEVWPNRYRRHCYADPASVGQRLIHLES